MFLIIALIAPAVVAIYEETFSAFPGLNSSIDAFDMMNWTEAEYMAIRQKNFSLVDDSFDAYFDSEMAGTGYYITAGTLGLVRPSQPFEIKFDIAAYEYRHNHAQGYGYTFTIWSLLDSLVDPVAPVFTFHTGMPPHEATTPEWKIGHPKFTTRVASGYGTCIAKVVEENSQYTKTPCNYVSEVESQTSAVGTNHRHESAKFQMSLNVDSERAARIVIKQYPSWTSDTPNRTIVDYVDRETWADYIESLDDKDSPRGFGFGTVLSGFKLSNLRVYVDADAVVATTSVATTVAQAAQTTTPTTVTPPLTSIATTATTTVTTVVQTSESTVTETTPVTTAPSTTTAPVPDIDTATTKTSSIIHSNDANRSIDTILVVTSFCVGGFCAALAMTIICFSQPMRRGWARIAGSRKKKVAEAFDKPPVADDASQSVVEQVVPGAETKAAMRNNYDAVPPVRNEYGRAPALRSSQYDQASSPLDSNYEDASDVLGKTRTVVYEQLGPDKRK